MIIVCQACAHHNPHNTLAERLWNQVDRSSSYRSAVGIEKRCWEWVGPTNKKGYGVGGNKGYGYVSLDNGKKKKGKKFYAHRLAYELTHGEIDEGLLVCHSCDNPLCCNPDHLFLGTHQENMADMVSKGRSTAKLPKKQVLMLIADYAGGDYTLLQLSEKYDISKTQTARIINRISRGTVSVDDQMVEQCDEVKKKPNLKRLTDKEVSEIRSHANDEKKYGLIKRLAEEYGVDRSAIYRIMQGETYSSDPVIH